MTKKNYVLRSKEVHTVTKRKRKSSGAIQENDEFTFIRYFMVPTKKVQYPYKNVMYCSFRNSHAFVKIIPMIFNHIHINFDMYISNTKFTINKGI